MSQPTIEEMLPKFEQMVNNSTVLSRWPLGQCTINGKFDHYMDADTDNLWIGFCCGYRLKTQELEHAS